MANDSTGRPGKLRYVLLGGLVGLILGNALAERKSRARQTVGES